MFGYASSSAAATQLMAFSSPQQTELAGSGMPGLSGMPAGTLSRASGVIPRYGVRLTVMTRPLAGG
jgi:PPE-SVP subfamily C-terminal region